MSGRRILGAICLAVLLCVTVGCGGSGLERATVKGTVSLDGEPIEQGVIAFVPVGDTKGSGGGAEIKDGEYSIPKDRGPSPGKHRVEITATRSTGTAEVKGVQGSTGGGPSGAGTAETLEMYVPAQYNSKSTLVFTVESGRNEENYELKSK